MCVCKGADAHSEEPESHPVLLCLFETEQGTAFFVPMWNFVYMVGRKGKRFNNLIPSTLNLA